MGTNQRSALARHIGELVAAHQNAYTDRELLRRFTQQRDESAFSALLQRHGSMILRVCRGNLGNTHDAEDVFQATFLVLLKKAPFLCGRDSLGGWLHEVAFRLALKTKSAGIQRSLKERHGTAEPLSDPVNALTLREAQAILHEELHRLSENLRAPLVLCYLESAAQEEAARQLGWSLRTFKRRLARGRSLLQLRLTGRGLTLSALLSTGLLAPSAASAGLIQSTLKAALSMGLGNDLAAISTPVAGLVHGAVGPLFMAKVKPLAVLIVLVSLLGTGLVLMGLTSQAVLPPEVNADQPIKPATKEKTPQFISGGPVKEKVEKPAVVDRFGDRLPAGALARLGTVRFRHDWKLDASAVSPDGRFLAGADSATIHIWDAETGQTLQRIPVNEFSGALAFAPNSKLLASVLS